MASQTVQVTLPAGITAVSGTVNGVETVFALTPQANIWQGTAQKTENGRYEVIIQGHNQQGVRSTLTTTLWYMAGWFAPVTDRTPADVATKTAKGCYNAEDLNRVGSDVRWLAEQLALCGYLVVVAPKSDWTREDFPTVIAMKTYLQNVAALVAGYQTLANTPSLPSTMDNLDWQRANALEQNLADLRQVLDWMTVCFKRSGSFYAGEGSGSLQR